MGNEDRMTNWETCPAVESVAGRLSGAWLFKGTRVPISSLFGNLADGATIKEYPRISDNTLDGLRVRDSRGITAG